MPKPSDPRPWYVEREPEIEAGIPRDVDPEFGNVVDADGSQTSKIRRHYSPTNALLEVNIESSNRPAGGGEANSPVGSLVFALSPAAVQTITHLKGIIDTFEGSYVTTHSFGVKIAGRGEATEQPPYENTGISLEPGALVWARGPAKISKNSFWILTSPSKSQEQVTVFGTLVAGTIYPNWHSQLSARKIANIVKLSRIRAQLAKNLEDSDEITLDTEITIPDSGNLTLRELAKEFKVKVSSNPVRTQEAIIAQLAAKIEEANKPSTDTTPIDIGVIEASEYILKKLETGFIVSSIRLENVSMPTSETFTSARPKYQYSKIEDVQEAEAELISGLSADDVPFKPTHSIGDVVRYDSSNHRSLRGSPKAGDPAVIVQQGILTNYPKSDACPACRDVLGREEQCVKCRRTESPKLVSKPGVIPLYALNTLDAAPSLPKTSPEIYRHIDLSQLVRMFPKAKSVVAAASGSPEGYSGEDVRTGVEAHPAFVRYDYLAWNQRGGYWAAIPSKFIIKTTFDNLRIAVVPVFDTLRFYDPKMLKTYDLKPIRLGYADSDHVNRIKVGYMAPAPAEQDFLTEEEVAKYKDQSISNPLQFDRGGHTVTVDIGVAPSKSIGDAKTLLSALRALQKDTSWYR